MGYTISEGGGSCGPGQWAVLDASGAQTGDCYDDEATAQAEADRLNGQASARWHAWGLAVDTASTDGREFASAGGGWRDLPLPLMLMTENDWGHDGARSAGLIDVLEMRDGLVYAEGTYNQTDVGEELRGYVTRQELRWVSADVEAMAMELVELLPDGTETPVAMPDFLFFGAERGEALGPTGSGVSEKAWDGAASRFTDEQYKRAAAACDGESDAPKTDCFLPHHEPDGTVNRAGVHAAAQRFSSLSGHTQDAMDTAASHLRSHYSTDLDEEPPDSIANAAEQEAAAFAAWHAVEMHDQPEEEGRIVERFTEWQIMGLTVLPFPAFPQCVIAPIDVPLPDAGAAGQQAAEGMGMARRLPAVAASGFPVRPPAGWFRDPEFGEPGEDERLCQDPVSGAWACPLTILASGQVFGHLAAWETCHTAFPDVCLSAPPSRTGYAYFLTGELETAEGEVLPVGQITLAGGHPDLGLSAAQAKAHYDETFSAVADVSAGEDIFGPWLAGALRPGLTDEQLRVLRASPPSGDWRPIGAGLELIAALAVNAQGYPIPRRTAHLASANGKGRRQTALIAAGTPIMARLMAGPRLLLRGRSFAELERRLDVLDRRTAPLRGLAAAALRERARS